MMITFNILGLDSSVFWWQSMFYIAGQNRVGMGTLNYHFEGLESFFDIREILLAWKQNPVLSQACLKETRFD